MVRLGLPIVSRLQIQEAKAVLVLQLAVASTITTTLPEAQLVEVVDQIIKTYIIVGRSIPQSYVEFTPSTQKVLLRYALRVTCKEYRPSGSHLCNLYVPTE